MRHQTTDHRIQSERSERSVLCPPSSVLCFIADNHFHFIEGNCVKYISRWRVKGGNEDLDKIAHYLDLLLELQENMDTAPRIALERYLRENEIPEIEAEIFRALFSRLPMRDVPTRVGEARTLLDRLRTDDRGQKTEQRAGRASGNRKRKTVKRSGLRPSED